jgi:hypothetical protein
VDEVGAESGAAALFERFGRLERIEAPGRFDLHRIHHEGTWIDAFLCGVIPTDFGASVDGDVLNAVLNEVRTMGDSKVVLASSRPFAFPFYDRSWAHSSHTKCKISDDGMTALAVFEFAGVTNHTGLEPRFTDAALAVHFLGLQIQGERQSAISEPSKSTERAPDPAPEATHPPSGSCSLEIDDAVEALRASRAAEESQRLAHEQSVEARWRQDAIGRGDAARRICEALAKLRTLAPPTVETRAVTTVERVREGLLQREREVNRPSTITTSKWVVELTVFAQSGGISEESFLTMRPWAHPADRQPTDPKPSVERLEFELYESGELSLGKSYWSGSEVRQPDQSLMYEYSEQRLAPTVFANCAAWIMAVRDSSMEEADNWTRCPTEAWAAGVVADVAARIVALDGPP